MAKINAIYFIFLAARFSTQGYADLQKIKEQNGEEIYAMVRWVIYVTRMENMRNSYKILIGKAEGSKPRKSRHK